MDYILVIIGIISILVVVFQKDIQSFWEGIKNRQQEKRESRYQMARAIQRLIVDAREHLAVAQALSPEMYNSRVLARFRSALQEYRRHIHNDVIEASKDAIADIEAHLERRELIQTERLKSHFSSIQHRYGSYLRYGENGTKYSIL